MQEERKRANPADFLPPDWSHSCYSVVTTLGKAVNANGNTSVIDQMVADETLWDWVDSAPYGEPSAAMRDCQMGIYSRNTGEDI